jgi:HD-GYP domain-containing protein (c-di-GMP phosphodiesterase class II)/DNA-binding LacI/PurR family transcriptional regulator
MTDIKKKLNQPKNGRLNIAFFVDWLEREYQVMIMQGLIDSARRRDVNLYCLEGGGIAGEKGEYDRNYMYQLVKGQNMDGLIILGGSVFRDTSAEQREEFCRQFQPLPIISIGAVVEGCTSVIIDNSTGLRDALAHLIQVHQYQKIAFIGGPKLNQDAIDRFRIFKQVLAEYNVPCDVNLVVEGDFCPMAGVEAVRTLLDQRHVTFDVIVAANDEMALGALGELQARGLNVPDQIAIIGFDDMKSCAYSNPPLTTINDSLYEHGTKAIDLMLDLIAHRPVPAKLYIPSRLILRQSCGCMSQTTLQCTSGAVAISNDRTGTAILKNQTQIIANIVEKSRPLFRYWAEIDLHQTVATLVDTFQRQLQGEKKEPFVKAFNQIIDESQRSGKELFFWQDCLSILRREILPYISSQDLLQSEDLFHQIRLMISEKAINQEKINNFDTLNRHQTLATLTELLLSAFSVSQVMTILTEYLPRLSIDAGYISEYSVSKLKCRIMMAYNRQGTVQFAQKGVFSDSLIPEVIANDGQPHILLMMMVYFSKKKFNVLAMEFQQQITDIYASLRRIITSSLAGVMLMERLHRQEKHLISQQEHLKNLKEMHKAMNGFIQTILAMMEVRDSYTAGHQSRVADLACAIANEMNFSREALEGLRMAGIIHDLGKIAVPFEILNKPGRLKPTEFALIKEHPIVANEILKNIDFPWPIAQIIVQHHERLNGSGYPAGLHSEAILPEAKILAVADVIEAMASYRPYRPALGIDKALDEITTNRGILYDSEVVDTCLKLFNSKGYQLN